MELFGQPNIWELPILKIVIYLKFKFNWTFCILFGNPTMRKLLLFFFFFSLTLKIALHNTCLQSVPGATCWGPAPVDPGKLEGETASANTLALIKY